MKRIRWNLFNIMDAAMGCNTRSQFAKVNQSAYVAAKRLGLLDKMFPILPKPALTEADIRLVAAKYRSRSAFLKGDFLAHKAAKEMGILDDLLPPLRPAPVRRKDPLAEMLNTLRKQSS